MRSNMSSSLLSKAIPMAVISAAFFAGSLAGLLFAASSSGSVADQLHTYLTDFISVTEREGVMTAVLPTVFFHIRWFLLCALGCIGTVGCVWIPMVVALRGFLISFSACCFARFIGTSGIACSAVLIGLPALFWMPIFFLLGMISLKFSLERAKLIFPEVRKGFHLRNGVLFSFFMFVVCILIECVLIPVLLPVLVRTL